MKKYFYASLITLALLSPALAADFSAVNVYPNPFRPAQSHTVIRFDGLPQRTDIRVYDAAGRLVFEKTDLGNNASFDWDVKNGRGQNVASGVYFFLLEAPDGDIEEGKLAVIR